MIIRDFGLKEYNTFKVDVKAAGFFEYSETSDLDCFFKDRIYGDAEYMVLGGGSNVLFVEDYPGTVLKSCDESFRVVEDSEESSLLKVGAGHDWDHFVSKTVSAGLKGLEPLSLIPGTVGAAPVQNIGAYGAEASQFIEVVECYDVKKKERVVLSNEDCDFSYRSSVFKKRPELIVVSVLFRLFKNNYGLHFKGSREGVGVVERLGLLKKLFVMVMRSFRFGRSTRWRIKMNFDNVRDILSHPFVPSVVKRKMVVSIRKRNMPDPRKVANVGCFFKSPVVDKDSLGKYGLDSSVKVYGYKDGLVKISAGDLIKLCGLHVEEKGRVGLDSNRPLIVINYDNASGKQIFDFSLYVIEKVRSETGVKIEPEVVIV